MVPGATEILESIWIQKVISYKGRVGIRRGSSPAAAGVWMARVASAFVLAQSIGCAREPTVPAERPRQLAVWSGDGQSARVSEFADQELTVRVTDAATDAAVEDATVEWRVLQGQGASLVDATSTSDAFGLASNQLFLGSELGSYVVEARVGDRDTEVVTFTAQAVLEPRVDDVQPTLVAAGASVVLQGANFSPNLNQNVVLFGGFRAQVQSATPTMLQVTAPLCLPSRPVEVRVAVGQVASDPVDVDGQSGGLTDLALAAGEGFVASSNADLDCLRFAVVDGGEYLIVPQNAASRFAPELPFEMRGLVNGQLTTVTATTAPPIHTQADWELQLRMRERDFEGGLIRSNPDVQLGAGTVPEVGDRREFRVLNSDGGTNRITAEVRIVTATAVLYEDVEAPSGGFDAADFATLASLFDDPIEPTVTSVFGAPSDVDSNGRIIILFSPRVNALTPRGQGSFIVGFFYGCDLVARDRCSDTNSAEVFYSMVPDPAGEFSNARSKQLVLQTVPGVLAHEFQHMISFAQRNQTLDALWLSEGLAHAAEDVVGDVFLERGDSARAAEFKFQNHNRASRYLAATERTPLLAEDGTGSLETRGGAWLLVKYITGQYGANGLLRRLTRSTLKGAANIVAETGQPWRRILGEFAVALWATEAPDLDGVQVGQRFLFADFDPRLAIGQVSGGYPLSPSVVPFSDFGSDYVLPAGGLAYLRIRHSAGTPLPLPMHFGASAAYGAAFPPSVDAGLTVFRIR